MDAVKDGKPWTLISGKVYNMKDLLNTHPGGPEFIVDIIGKDGTDLYTEHHETSEAAHRQDFVTKPMVNAVHVAWPLML